MQTLNYKLKGNDEMLKIRNIISVSIRDNSLYVSFTDGSIESIPIHIIDTAELIFISGK